MKKRIKFLSGFLACLMVLSALPAFASSGSDTPEAFFEDFEVGFSTGLELKESQDSEFIAAGFNKGMAKNYNIISGNTTTGFAAKVVEDEVMGKAYQTPAGVDMFFGIGFDEPVYSGAVKLSYRMTANNQGFPFVMYAQTMGAAYGSADSKKTYMGQIERLSSGCQVTLSGSKTYSQAANTTKKQLSGGNYYTLEWIVDVDTDTRYLFVDGVEMGHFTEPSTNPINSMQGFYFDHSGGTHSKYSMPLIDDITLTAYDFDSKTMNHVKTVNRDGMVKLVFDEIIDDGLSASDISFKEAGGDSTVDATEIKVVGNTLEVSYDADAVKENREYVLVSENLKSKNGDKPAGETAAILCENADVFSVEKVRFVNKNGAKTGMDEVSPEITAIELTFSDVADAELIESVSVMAEATETEEAQAVAVTDYILSDDEMTATLSIPGMLLGDRDYTIAIADPEFTYSFKTAEGQFAVTNLVATKADDSDLTFGTTPAEGDSIKLSAEIINTEGLDRQYTVIYTYYNDDMLVAMDSKAYEISKTKYFDTFTWTADTVRGSVEYDTVRIFVWDSIDGAEALADYEIYSSK